jgi:hypothetical protein
MKKITKIGCTIGLVKGYLIIDENNKFIGTIYNSQRTSKEEGKWNYCTSNIDYPSFGNVFTIKEGIDILKYHSR